MSEQAFTVLYLSLLVIGLVWLSFAFRLSYLKAHRRMIMQKRDEGYSGKFLKDYQPRTTIHSLVNRLFARNKGTK